MSLGLRFLAYKMKAIVAPSSKPTRTEEDEAKSARNCELFWVVREQTFGKNFNSYRFALMYLRRKQASLIPGFYGQQS